MRAPLDRFIALGVGTWRIDVVISPVGTVIDADSKHPWPIATLQVTIDAP